LGDKEDNAEMASTHPQEEFIGTVDVWALRHTRWPLMNMLARRFVDTRELCAYERDLLASGRWAVVRTEPHVGDAGAASTHVFDVYGVRAP
jgi:hypothetical protein